MRILILFLFFSSILFTRQAQAINYYWVGGSGSWSDYAHHWATSSGGTTFQSQVPTNLDNVYFDQNSGFVSGNKTVSVDQTIVYCKDMDWTGVLNYPVFNSTFSNNTLKIFGSLTISPNMNFDFNTNLSFESTSPGNIIKCSGKSIAAYTVYFNGVNGEWTFSDNFNASHTVTHNAGTIHSNNKIVNMGSYIVNGTAVASFDVGSSVVNITQLSQYLGSNTAVPGWSISNANYSIDPSQMVLNFLGIKSVGFFSTANNYNIINSSSGLLDFNCQDCTVKALNFGGSGNITSNTTYEQLSLVAGGIYNLAGTTTITDGGTLTANGTCSAPIFLQADNQSFRNTFYTIHKNTGTIQVNYVYLQNARTSGTATFNAVDSYSLGNVTGWNINNPTAKNLYWVGGSGNWNDPNHWSQTSGGTISSGCVPTYSDNVFFDQNSGFIGSGTVTLNAYKSQCKNMDWSGITSNVTLYSDRKILYISGSLTLSPKFSFANYQSQIILNSQSTGNTITSAGKTIPETLIFDGIGGEWTMTDSLTATYVKFYNGSLLTNDKNLTLTTLSCSPDVSGSVSLNLQSSLVKLMGASWNMNATGVNFNCGTSTLLLYTGTAQDLNAGPHQFYNVYSYCGTGTISASQIRKLYLRGNGILGTNQTYDSLIFSAGRSYQINGTSYTVNKDFIANGACGQFIAISGANATTTLYKSSGTVLCDGLILTNFNAAGGATFTAYNSQALSAITGWNINAYVPRTLYWVGGAGSWSDKNHWSLSSGGSGGECMPVRFDNVFFDQNSGILRNATITCTNAEYHTMDWSAINVKCNFTGGTHNIYGSLILHDSVAAGITPTFLSSSPEIIKTGKLSAYGKITFDGTGTWTAQDNFTTNQISHKRGKFVVNGNTITIANGYNAASANNATLDLRNSKLIINKNAFHASIYGLVLMPTNSIIEFLNQDPMWYPAGINYYSCCTISEPTFGGTTFGKVICRNNAAKFVVRGGLHSFTYLYAEGGAIIDNSCSYDTLALTPGRTYTFASGSTQTIRIKLDAIGLPGFPIEMLSSAVGTSANIYKSSGMVCAEYLYLRDIHATGGASFYAGDNGANVNNNTGWIFAACGTVTPVLNAVAIKMNIYPIPANSTFNYTIEGNGTYTVKLYNTLNEEMYSGQVQGDVQYSSDVSSYLPGLYYLSVEETGQVYKIIISH